MTTFVEKFIAKLGGSDISAGALKAIIISGTLSVFLKIFGLIKESILANYFGISGELDIYILVMIALLFFVNPVAGAVGTLLTQKYIETKQYSETLAASIYLRCLFASTVLIALIISLQISLFKFNVPYFFFDDSLPYADKKDLVILVPVAIFSGVAVINAAILTAERRFVLFSSLPSFVPLSIIICLAVNISGDPFTSLLYGTVLGFCLEMVGGTFALLTLWKSMTKKISDVAVQKLAEVKSGFLPLFSASLFMSGCIVVDQFMAALAGEGAVSVVNFGSRISYGLISVAGIIWIVLYPIFSELVTKNQHETLKKIYIRFIILCVAFVLPSCALISLFSEELIAAFFQRGAFNEADTVIVSQLQVFYLLFIPLYIVCILSIRVANSFENQRIVFLGNGLALALNILLNLIFIRVFGVLGIAMATLLSYFFMAILWFVVIVRFVLPSHEIRNNKIIPQLNKLVAPSHFKFQIHCLANIINWLVSKTDKQIFALLFNLKSIAISSPARTLWQDGKFMFYDKSLPGIHRYIRHQKQANSAYQKGFMNRAQQMDNCYFLAKIGFSDGDTVIDCGANVGDLKLWFDIHNIKINYIGFEPSTIEFNCLKENISSGIAHNVGLWNDSGEKNFYLSSQNADSSYLKPKSFDEVIAFRTERLETFIESPVKYLKLEAEGGEPEILDGLGKSINQIQYIAADLGFERGVNAESTLVPVTNYLLSNGFEMVDIYQNRISVLFRNKNFGCDN